MRDQWIFIGTNVMLKIALLFLFKKTYIFKASNSWAFSFGIVKLVGRRELRAADSSKFALYALGSVTSKSGWFPTQWCRNFSRILFPPASKRMHVSICLHCLGLQLAVQSGCLWKWTSPLQSVYNTFFFSWMGVWGTHFLSSFSKDQFLPVL